MAWARPDQAGRYTRSRRDICLMSLILRTEYGSRWVGPEGRRSCRDQRKHAHYRVFSGLRKTFTGYPAGRRGGPL